MDTTTKSTVASFPVRIETRRGMDAQIVWSFSAVVNVGTTRAEIASGSGFPSELAAISAAHEAIAERALAVRFQEVRTTNAERDELDAAKRDAEEEIVPVCDACGEPGTEDEPLREYRHRGDYVLGHARC